SADGGRRARGVDPAAAARLRLSSAQRPLQYTCAVSTSAPWGAGLPCGEKWSMVGIRGRDHEPVMFYGEYEHTVDEKNRVTLPARFRHGLASGVVLARGIERNIDVYPSDSWHDNVARIADLDSLTREAREMKRYVFAGAAVAELDRQGRVLVPPHLGEHAGLGK